ncbi:MAG TPA: hypothetical protein VIT64_04700, partial [Ilumatobacteraceae bacterium]
MSRTTEPSPAADESAGDGDDTTVDPTPPGGIARVDDIDDIEVADDDVAEVDVVDVEVDDAEVDVVEVDVAEVEVADVEVGGETDQNFRVLEVPIITAETVVVAPEEPVEPPVVVADPDPKRPIRSVLGPRDLVQAISTLIVVVGVSVFTFVQLHPSRIFSSAVPTGGDMGAHLWAPAYLRDHLLPHGRVIGWSMDWYAGLPVYRFYMLPPALLILLLDVVMSYGMAFKIIVVLGVLTLPVCCWAFGRLSRFPYPIPALFAVAGTIFLFDETFTILGGNIASTMAGEFSFSIALSLAMLALGVFARGMENGKHRALAAILIALAALTHGIVVFFVVVGVV